MLYRGFKFLFYVTLRCFFRKIKINNLHLIPKDKPVIIIANHNSAAIDPLVIADMVRKPVYFLARAETFSNAFRRWFLSRLHLIPIYRSEIFPGKEFKNRDVFKTCFKKLSDKKTLIIFPEAVSMSSPCIRELKPGAARIGLGAEDANAFSLDVQIIPVGINFSNSHKFRSDLLINIGKPISVSNYRGLFVSNKSEAVRQLTNDAKLELESLIVNVFDMKSKEVISRLAEMQMNSDDSVMKNESLIKRFETEKINAEKLKNLDSIKKEALGENTDVYFEMLKEEKTNDKTIKSSSHSTPKILMKTCLLILTLPLLLAGLISNIIPYSIAALISKKLTKREDFMGTMKIIPGLFVFLICYILETIVFYQIASDFIPTVSFAIFLIPTGLIAVEWIWSFNDLRSKIKWNTILRKQNEKAMSILNLRSKILEMFDSSSSGSEESYPLPVEDQLILR